MRIRPINKFVRFTFSFIFGPFTGISLCPFAIYIDPRDIKNECVLNHEKIHWRQQLEMLILPFYIWYIVELIIKTIRDKDTAYTCMSFEREAYKNQYELNYLKKRKPYAWVKYLRLK